jgi:hypothetical protein
MLVNFFVLLCFFFLIKNGPAAPFLKNISNEKNPIIGVPNMQILQLWSVFMFFKIKLIDYFRLEMQK